MYLTRTMLITSFFLLLFACEKNPVQQCPVEESDNLKILFIGNSYTEMGDVRLTDNFAGLVKASGKQLYIGKTNNLDKRINDHNSGKVISTKSRLPFVLESFISVQTESIAINLEKYLKTGSGHTFLYNRLGIQSLSSSEALA